MTFLALAPACGDLHSLGVLTDTTAGSGEPPGSTGESTAAPSTSASTSPTESGGASTGGATETDGGNELLCEIPVNDFYLYTSMYAVFPAGEVDEPCVVAGVAEDGPALVLTLQCPDFAAQFGGDFIVRIEQGPRPAPLPAVDDVLDVFAGGFDDDVIYTSHAFLSLRRGDALVYAVTQGEVLLSEVAGATIYSPLDVARVDVCDYLEVGETGVVDATLLCSLAALSRLAVLVGGEEELQLAEGETTTVVAGGVPYAIDLAQVRRLKACNIDPPAEEFPRYDFAIAAQLE